MTELEEVAQALSDRYLAGLNAMGMESTFELALVFVEQQMEGESDSIIAAVADILNKTWRKS